MNSKRTIILQRSSKKDNYFECVSDSGKEFTRLLFFIKIDKSGKKYISNVIGETILPLRADRFRQIDNIKKIQQESHLFSYKCEFEEGWVCDDMPDTKVILLIK